MMVTYVTRLQRSEHIASDRYLVQTQMTCWWIVWVGRRANVKPIFSQHYIMPADTRRIVRIRERAPVDPCSHTPPPPQGHGLRHNIRCLDRTMWKHMPPNTTCCLCAGAMPGQRHCRSPDIEPALHQCPEHILKIIPTWMKAEVLKKRQENTVTLFKHYTFHKSPFRDR